MGEHDTPYGEGRTETDATFDLALSATDPAKLDPKTNDVLSVVVPAGAEHKLLDLERFLPVPRRVTGTARLQTVDDLVKYVTRHDDQSSTTLWVDEDNARIVALLNDHAGRAGEDGGPRAEWGDHQAVLQLRPTPEWVHWTENDNKLLEQVAFAEHIEDGLLEFVEPDGATMLEIAQSIEGARNVEFKQAERLHDGNVAVQWTETTTAKAGQRGDEQIPERFTLAVAPFLGEQPATIQARLRYRLSGGSLMLGYKLEHPDRVVREVIDAVADRLDTTFTGDRVFIGVPRSTRAEVPA